MDRYVIDCTGVKGIAKVTDVTHLDDGDVGDLDSQIFYASDKVFFAVLRGQLSDSAAFLRGLSKFSGNSKQATALDPVFKPLVDALVQRADDTAAPDVDAEALTATISPPTPPPWYAVHTRAWWLYHAGTDLLLGNWLTLVGCILWFVVGLWPILSSGGKGSGYDWATVASAACFSIGFYEILIISYPHNFSAMLLELEVDHSAKPHGDYHPGRGVAAAFDNRMYRGMMVMNVGFLPFIVWGGFAFWQHGLTSVIGWTVVAFVALFLPATVLMMHSSSAESLKDMMAGGEGSQHFFNYVRSRPRAFCCCRPESPFFARHFGSDGRAGSWCAGSVPAAVPRPSLTRRSALLRQVVLRHHAPLPDSHHGRPHYDAPRPHDAAQLLDDHRLHRGNRAATPRPVPGEHDLVHHLWQWAGDALMLCG